MGTPKGQKTVATNWVERVNVILHAFIIRHPKVKPELFKSDALQFLTVLVILKCINQLYCSNIFKICLLTLNHFSSL